MRDHGGIPDLVAFLTTRLDEDELAARAAHPGPWTVDGASIIGKHPTDEVVDYVYDESAAHIARHDPGRVFAEIDAKRQIIERCRRIIESFGIPEAGSWPDVSRRERSHANMTLTLLALPYADHPDYDEAWQP
jgi:hypothetical protein